MSLLHIYKISKLHFGSLTFFCLDFSTTKVHQNAWLDLLAYFFDLLISIKALADICKNLPKLRILGKLFGKEAKTL